MTDHLSPATLPALVKDPRSNSALLAHLSEPCPECDAFLDSLGGWQQRESLVAVLLERARQPDT
jgi:hypothetical protein